VDRLEERDLVERRLQPNDRRVKQVALTALGRKTKTKLEKKLFAPPAQMTNLDPKVLSALRDFLVGLKPPAKR